MTKSATQLKRERIWIGIALVILAIYALLSFRETQTQMRMLVEAREELGETQTKLAEIDKLRTAPKVAALTLEAPAEIVNRIAQARQAAGLPQASLLSQQPQTPQRIGRTDFQERITVIKLDSTSMEKIIRFCEALQNDQTGTIIRDLTLTPPQLGQNTGPEEKWGAELVLTQMIFSPKSVGALNIESTPPFFPSQRGSFTNETPPS